ncbi:MAG: hypothetical protein ABEJ79_04300 [Halolamina sp.]
MNPERDYRCLNCESQTVSRSYDVSHLSTTCSNCGSFGRFINDAVFAKYESFEESPPTELEWDSLDRTEKLLISERVVRTDRSPADFAPEE